MNYSSKKYLSENSDVILKNPINIDLEITSDSEFHFFENEKSAKKLIDEFFVISKSKARNNLIISTSKEVSNENYVESTEVGHEQNFLIWRTLSKLYNNIYKLSDFPPPTATLLTENFIAVGTTQGNIHLFNHNEFLMLTLASDPENKLLQLPISKIKLSNDGTHVAASNSDGILILWDLNKRNNETETIKNIKPWFHILSKGYDDFISNFGFLGVENNKLIALYKNRLDGLSSYTMVHEIKIAEKKKWLSTKASANLTSKQVLFKNPGNSNLAIEALSEYQGFEELITAVITCRSIQIISFSQEYPIIFTKTLKLIEITEKDSLRWLILDKSKLLLCFTRANIFYGLTFSIGGNQSGNSTWELVDEFNYNLTENIFSFEIIGQFLALILLENNELLIFDLLNGIITQKIEFSDENIIKPLEKSIAFSGDRLISVLTRKGVLLAEFASWQNVLLQNLRSKQPVLALEFLEHISEPKNKDLRRLLNVPSYEKDKDSKMSETFSSLVQAALILIVKQQNSLVDYQYTEHEIAEIFSFFKKTAKLDYHFNKNNLTVSMEILDNDSIVTHPVLKKAFFNGLGLLLGKVKKKGQYFPPLIVNSVLENIAFIQNFEMTIRNIINFDLSCFNIDLLIKHFIMEKDFLTCIYVWAKALNDFETPFCDLIECITGRTTISDVFGKITKDNIPLLVEVLFIYLNDIFDGSIFDKEIGENNFQQDTIKFLVNGSCTKFSPNSKNITFTQKKSSDEPTYPYLRFLLGLDSEKLLSLLKMYFLKNFELKSQETDFILDILFEILEQYLNTEHEKIKSIKQIGLFLTLFLDSQRTLFGIKQNLNILFLSLTCSEMYQKESESALTLLSKKVELVKLSKDAFVIFKRLNYKNILMQTYFVNKDYFFCLKVAFDLKIKNVFDLIQTCWEELSDSEEKSSLAGSQMVDLDSSTDVMTLYDLESLIKQNFTILCEINIIQSIEIMFLYDFDFEDILVNMAKSHTNKTLVLKIMETIISDSRFQLPFLLYSEYLKMVIESGESKEMIEKKLDMLLQNEPISKRNIDAIVSLLKEHNYYKHLVKLLMTTIYTEQALLECLKAISLKSAESQKIGGEKDVVYFINTAFNICKKSNNLLNWSTFFLYFFKLNQETLFEDMKRLSSNALTNATVQLSMMYDHENDCSFLNVIENILENSSVILGKVASISDALYDFSFSFRIETAFLQLILKIFNKDAKKVSKLTELKLRGWLINNQQCSSCNLNIREKREQYTEFFRCGHHFHRECFIAKASGLDTCYICSS
ncbi:hypothetical protein QEN19_001654 [Hanseniaspora menglaensis]